MDDLFFNDTKFDFEQKKKKDTIDGSFKKFGPRKKLETVFMSKQLF